MADEAAREDHLDEAIGPGPRLDREELGMDPPRNVGRLEAEAPVALALATGDRVDDVEGLAGAGDVVGGEVLPDEAADQQDAPRAERRELRELVVLIAEDRLDPAALHPRGVLVAG